jgi:hypothetical protein
MFRKILGLVSIMFLATLVSWADNWNKKTILTVKEVIQVPGAVLQPGTYVMKLVDSLADRHIVRITNEREDEVITTILAIPNYRLKPTDKSQFQFWETPAGNPRVMRAWFYPGDNFGQEFAYPKGLSTTIAAYTETSVPYTSATKEVELPKAPVILMDKSGVERPLEARVYTPPTPAAAAAPATPPAPVLVAQADKTTLPATASPIPALGLLGFFAIVIGLALRRAVPAR